MKAPLSASQLVSQNCFFSKTNDRNFMKFQTNFLFLKDKKVIQSRQNLIFGKKPEISLKVRLFAVGKDIASLVCYFWVYMMHHGCLYDSAKTACFGKTSFSSYKQNSSWPIIWHLSFNITKAI